MSKNPTETFIIHDDHVKVHGKVKIKDRVKVHGRVQAHGHVKTSVSGNIVNVILISGQSISISGQSVNISGQLVNSLTPTVLRNGYSQITDTSGGTQLSSGVIVFTNVESIPGNDPMWIGAPGVNSGTGYLLVAGNHKDISIDNLNKIFIFAQTSGQFVSWLAED